MNDAEKRPNPDEPSAAQYLGNLRNGVRLVDRDYDLDAQKADQILGFVMPLRFASDPADFERGFEGRAETPSGTTR